MALREVPATPAGTLIGTDASQLCTSPTGAVIGTIASALPPLL